MSGIEVLVIGIVEDAGLLSRDVVRWPVLRSDGLHCEVHVTDDDGNVQVAVDGRLMTRMVVVPLTQEQHAELEGITQLQPPRIDLTRAVEIGVDAWIAAMPEIPSGDAVMTTAFMRHSIGERLLPVVTALIEFFEQETQ